MLFCHHRAQHLDNAIAGIDQIISSTTDAAQRAALQGQRNQLLVDEQTALAQHPTDGVGRRAQGRSSGAGQEDRRLSGW